MEDSLRWYEMMALQMSLMMHAPHMTLLVRQADR